MPATNSAAVRAVGGRIPFTGAPVRLGRDPANDLVLDDPNVSRFHAVIEPEAGAVRVRDLASRNGTRLDGAPVAQAPLRPGAEIGIGSFALTFTGREMRTRSERGAVSVEAIGVSMSVRGRQILAATDLKVRPGELVCIIGENGAGKSTLLRALAGAEPISSGQVLINHQPLAQRRTDVGYVPQDDTVHPWLTVEEALCYGAELRLPDHTPAERDRAVEEVIERLGLGERPGAGEPALRERLIGADDVPAAGRLSGGQRKRVCVAMEMLAQPSVVLLDEPTSPLDPLYAEELVKLLLGLARSRCSVVMVTHKPDDVELCDKVAVMARGGHLSFYGTPAAALRFFGVSTYRDIYGALKRRAAAPRISDPAPGTHDRTTPTSGRAPQSSSNATSQAKILARRYAKLLGRDRSNLLGTVASVPVIALLLLAFPRDVLRTSRAPTFLFVLVFVLILLGVVASFRELVRERPIARRERAVGVGVTAYLASKLLVLGGVAAAQAIALGSVAFACHPPGGSGWSYAAGLGVLVLASWAGVAIGLVISALARSQEQATTLIAIPLVLQLLFAGAIIPLRGIEGPAALMPARWAFGALGRLAGLSARAGIAGDAASAFAPGVATGVLALLVSAVALSGVVLWNLARAR